MRDGAGIIELAGVLDDKPRVREGIVHRLGLVGYAKGMRLLEFMQAGDKVELLRDKDLGGARLGLGGSAESGDRDQAQRQREKQRRKLFEFHTFSSVFLPG